MHGTGEQTKDEYIRREAAVKAIATAHWDGYKADKYIWDIPAADVKPVVRGKWKSSPWDAYCFRCSVCGGEVGTKWPFCHHCGAQMEGTQ